MRPSNDTRRFRLRASAFFALVNLVAVWAIATRYLPYFNAPDDAWGWVYFITTWTGHFGLLAELAWLPLAVLALFISKRALIIPSALLASVVLWILALDTVVFSQYRFHLNSFMLSLFLNDKNGEIFDFSVMTWVVGIVVVILLVLFELWLAWRILARARSIRFPVWKTFIALFALMVTSHLIHVVGDARYDRSITQQTAIYPLFFPATAKDFMEKHGWLDPRAARAEGLELGGGASDSLDWPKAPLTCTPGEKAPNIIVIALDSWRFDEYDAKTVPNIYAAMSDGTRFMDHFSGGNATRNGVFSLFYALSGNYWQVMQNNQMPSLFIRTLQKHDYPLGLFGSASFDGIGFDRTIFASVPHLRLRTQEGDTPAARDANMTQDWLDWQQQRRQNSPEHPYFGFLFYDAPHGYSVPPDADKPWQPSADEMNYVELGPDTDPTPIRNLHRNAAHYDDTLIKRVIDDLKASGEWDNTILVITSDHGQEFNDTHHNYWGHNSNFARWQTQVPLVIRGPGIAQAQHTGMTSHLDVVPTLMTHGLGCTNPPSDYSMGKDLLTPGLDHKWVITNSYISYGIIEPDRITAVHNTGGWEVYDPQLNPLPEQTFSPAVFDAVNAMRRFFK